MSSRRTKELLQKALTPAALQEFMEDTWHPYLSSTDLGIRLEINLNSRIRLRQKTDHGWLTTWEGGAEEAIAKVSEFIA